MQKQVSLAAFFMLFYLCGSSAAVQSGGAGTSVAYVDCIQSKVCTGASLSGQCEAQGYFCFGQDTGCISAADGSADGCRWQWIFSCAGPSKYRCMIVEGERIGTNCGPQCQLMTYNQCVCSCADIGARTVESSFYTWCARN
jgi:hypothetical protein